MANTGDWNTATNWSGSALPSLVAGTELDTPGGGSAPITVTDDLAAFSISTLRFINTSAYTDTLVAGSSANTITMVPNGSTVAQINQASTNGAYNISVPIIFTSGLSFGGGQKGALNILGSLTGTGPMTVANATGEVVSIDGAFTTTGNINISGSAFLTIGTGGMLPSTTVTGTSTTTTGALTFNNADINSSAAAINSSIRVVKTGVGTFSLSGNSNYSGGTNVSAGNLYALSATSIGTGTLNVSSGANFSYMPTAAWTLNLSSGTINLATGSTIGTAIGGTLGQSAINANSSTASVGAVTLNIYGISGVAATTGTNNLITALGGLNASGASYTLGKIYNATNFTVTPGSLATSATAVSVGVTSATALTTEYWKGGFSGGSAWAISDGSTSSNWGSDASGTGTSLVPGPTSNVIFSATGATNQSSMTLGANMSVAGIVVNDTSPIALNADGYTLTLGAGGVTINNTAGNPTVALNAAISLGAAQSWNTSSTNALTIGGTVAIGANQLSLTGTGPINISGTLSGTGNLALAGSNAFTINGNLTNTGGLTVTGSTLTTLSGTFSGTGALALAGPGAVTISGTASYTGTTTVNSGGKLTYSGSGAITSSSNLTVAGTAGTGQVFYNSSATSNFGVFNIGNAVGGSGAFTQTSGVVNANVGGAYVELGYNAVGAYGSYTLAGGTFNVSPTSNGGMEIGDTGGYGSFTQTGVSCLSRGTWSWAKQPALPLVRVSQRLSGVWRTLLRDNLLSSVTMVELAT